MNTHIEQLAEWWENAEKGSPSPGDTIIINLGGDGYLIEAASEHWGDEEQYDDTRILARAPKPEPAWHDADFVVARYENDDHWQGYLRHGDLWIDSEGQKYTAGVLRDVTPLIEAKVTDEMRARAIAAYEEDHGSFAARIDATLNAALGLEAE